MQGRRGAEGLLLAAILIGVLGTAVPARAVLLYEVGFGRGDIGFAPPLDTGPYPRSGPSDCLSCRLWGTSPRIRNQIGALQDRPLEFAIDAGATISNEQITFDVPSNYDAYHLSLDLDAESLLASNVGTGFYIFFDAPKVFTVEFQPGFWKPTSTLPLLPLPMGTALPVNMTMDFSGKRWSISVGSSSTAGVLDTSYYTGLRSIRLVLVGSGQLVGVDNIRITAVPEPGTLALLALCAVVVPLTTKRRAR